MGMIAFAEINLNNCIQDIDKNANICKKYGWVLVINCNLK